MTDKEKSYAEIVKHNEDLYKRIKELKKEIEKVSEGILPVPKMKEADLIASNKAALNSRKEKFAKKSEQQAAIKAVFQANAKGKQGKK